MSPAAPAPRELDASELGAANAVYAELDFEPSSPGRDRTFGLFEAGELVALGRVSAHPDGALELGGFWTRPDRRGRGHARALVAHAIAALPPGRTAWCVPFDHLVDFYRGFGMERPGEALAVPVSIRAKQDRCLQSTCASAYRRTTLLVLRAPAG